MFSLTSWDCRGGNSYPTISCWFLGDSLSSTAQTNTAVFLILEAEEKKLDSFKYTSKEGPEIEILNEEDIYYTKMAEKELEENIPGVKCIE